MPQLEIVGLSHDLYEIFEMVRASDTGLTEAELREKAQANGIKEPMKLFGQLVSGGLCRIQDRGDEFRERRLKATKKAFLVRVDKIS